MEGWKPLTTLARQAKVPEASARRYAETFSPYFRFRKVGKARLYDPACVPLLRVISETYGQGSRTPEVEEVVAARFGQVHEVVTHRQELATATSPAELAPILQAFTVSLDRLALAQERQNTLLERQNELLGKLALAGVALPGKTPSDSPQEAPGGTEEGGGVESGGAVPENASEGQNWPSWWKRLWGRRD